ncbi:Peptidase B [Rubrivivax sp. A210]|uniref:leucyl aminopeptidase family protein n=1 Tax=Rubrivivax sp. A210 TaxID=2772301 RepID=UPI00191B79B9|nr:leucyl aminopeptidase family protein [Rubrivivax sp. A210]CAD5369687.1 Peptidase B [Rubrivivax sp. A210]
MTVELTHTPGRDSVALYTVDRAGFAERAPGLDAASARWLQTVGFAGAPDSHALLPAPDGSLRAVWAGVRDAGDPWALAALPKALPPGRYHLAAEAPLALDAAAAALSWELGAYTFDAYKPARREPGRLALAPSPEIHKALIVAAAIASTRDLVNTPAEHMGPASLAQAVRLVAEQHGAKFKETVGDKLLAAGFPAIHAVGRAADAARAPRLIELNWGKAKHPRLTLVGKGVCFDTGGLDIKGADGMRLMKKDMGGAANALGLAQMIMALKLPLRLQLLIPAVENAIAGNAYRPGDVFKTRQGLHIEIGNTDAEGRVILCDALAYGAESRPELMIDLATLTGAARVALGSQLPALFCRRMELARELVDRGLAARDPLWHLPLWRDYHGGIESEIADIVNTGKGALGGAINAALFLEDFVPAGLDWLHIDLFAWNDGARPGRPVGGEAQTLRTLLGYLEARFGSA